MDEYRDLANCNVLRMDQFGILDSVHAEFPALVPKCVEAECHYDVVERVLKNGTVNNIILLNSFNLRIRAL